MEKKSMIGMAYQIIKEKKTISFDDLWSEIEKEIKFSNNEEKINKKTDFYMQLTLDGRFKCSDNLWSL